MQDKWSRGNSRIATREGEERRDESGEEKERQQRKEEIKIHFEVGKEEKTISEGKRTDSMKSSGEGRKEERKKIGETRKKTGEKKRGRKDDNEVDKGLKLEVCGITIPSEYDPMRYV